MPATKLGVRQFTPSGAANRIFATPNLASGDAALRLMTENDLPLISAVTTITPAYDDSVFLGDASASQNGRATISDVLAIALQGHITGLEVEWIATNQLKVKTGVAHIQSGGIIVKLTADSTKTLTGLSANTWYYVYVFESSGVLDWEWSTTAPASPYFGSARSMTGVQTRRFIFCFRTGGSSQILKFVYNPLSGAVNYQEDFSVSPFRVLGPGQSTAQSPWATVSAAAVVPPISTLTTMRIQNYQSPPNHVTASGRISIPGDTTLRLIINVGADTLASVIVNSSQQFAYYMESTPTGIAGLYVDVKEFIFLR